MRELRRVTPAQRGKVDKERLTRLAESQGGVLSRAQLESSGVSDSAISRWVAAGWLHRIHRGVYALGHRALSIHGRLHAARLYAGDAAAFSHTTAAWLWQIIENEPTRIHLSHPGRRQSLPEVRVHQGRPVGPLDCRGFPATPPARTLLDLATILTSRQLRRAVAEADYRSLLDVRELDLVLGRGRPGASALRAALHRHMPALARTFSALEERFLELCEKACLPQPEVNARVGGMTVDCLWCEQRLIVELDGGPAHGGPAAMKRDRERELALRAMGYTVIRYAWQQVTERPAEVAADVRSTLASRRATAA